MQTTLTPEHLAQLQAEGRYHAHADGPFVNPHTVDAVKVILRQRGEEWAASVLLRPLTRRSLWESIWPWFETGEMETLIIADRAEWSMLENSLK